MELNPLKMIDPVVIVAVIGIFIITHYLMRRTLMPVIEAMERRQSRLEAADSQRDEAADLGRTAEAEAGTILERARRRAESLSTTIRERGGDLRSRRLDEARAQAGTYLEQGRQAIAIEREAELTKLRGETSACVTLACKRLLGGVETRSVDEIVDRLVAKRVH